MKFLTDRITKGIFHMELFPRRFTQKFIQKNFAQGTFSGEISYTEVFSMIFLHKAFWRKFCIGVSK